MLGWPLCRLLELTGCRPVTPPPSSDTKVALLSVPRSNITLNDLRRRVSQALSQQDQGAAPTEGSSPPRSSSASLRYRLPGESAQDGLVQLSSDDDLALMLEEYDCLQARAPQGGPQSRLHVYVASPGTAASSGRTSPASDASGGGSPPSPRSVLLSWQAAARQGANAGAGAPAPKSVMAMEVDAAPPSDGQGQENASGSPHGVGDRRKAPHRASPAPRGPHHHAGGASASMLMLAEAVVANVLGDEGAFTKGSQQQQQLQAFGQQGQMWTPATPVRATHAMAPAGMETPGGVPHHPGPGLFPLGGVPTIAADDMELGPRLGDGTYAVVHAGWWRGAAVAVKILRRSTTGDGQAQQQQPGGQAGYARAVDAFAREAALLARLQHPNVLALYGVVAPTSLEVPPAAVLELMPHGSLTQSLRARRLPPCIRTAACLALGAARAMQHLHAQSPPVVHFDLKADNLLVDWRDPGQPVCKLSDLGLACTLTPALATRATGRGTLWWMAPELFPGAPAGLQCRIGTPLDVFSFGLVLWEIATSGAEPYPPGTPPEAVVDAVRRGLRPSAPLGCDPRWVALMSACWAGDPGARPTFDQVVRQLVALLRG